VPFSRGKRVSILAAMDITGFFAWGNIDDTFTRCLRLLSCGVIEALDRPGRLLHVAASSSDRFHKMLKEQILPFLNPWPLPRSIVVMDNANIHMYEELQDLVHAAGALLFFLPPYSPDLNPIEVGFSLLKR
jgi:hypothetical protein